ncbi:MAG: hypothetical protein FJX75_04570 [Armatimonadetes bacterium]|nr:hypothetical protein [Armatimonadota bacterium]
MLARVRSAYLLVVALLLASPSLPQTPSRMPLDSATLGGLPRWIAPVLADQPEPPPVGGTIVVNSLGRWGFYPKADGFIYIDEAFTYAAQDAAANQITFDPALDGPGGIVFDHWGWGLGLSGNGDSFVGDFGSYNPRVKLADQLTVSGNQCLVRGLCLLRVEVSGDENKVQACHFALDLDAETSWAPAFAPGLNVSGNRNVVGGDRVWYRNHFGKAGTGGPVGINGEENVFCTNVVGLKPDLWTPLAYPPVSGLWVGGQHNRIGDIENRFNCIYATEMCMNVGGNSGDDGHENTIRQNYLGQNNAGAKCRYGLVIEDGAHGNVIGGSVSPGYGPNVIVNFTEAGIRIEPNCDDTTVVGTCIGMNQWGNAVAPEEQAWGIVVGRGVSGTKIGSADATQRNRCGRQGIRVRENARNTVIRGNWMGFDKDNQPIGAGYYHHGIEAIGAGRLTIGGAHKSGADEGNVLVGYTVPIHLTDCTGPVVIEGNTIGALPDRSAPAGGRGFGVTADGCSNLRLGPRIVTTAATARDAPTGVPSALYGNLIVPGRECIGIQLGLCQSVQVEGNTIGWESTAFMGAGETGVYVGTGSHDVKIGGTIGNRIYRNGTNVALYGAYDVSLSNNQIRHATEEVGLFVGGGVHDVTALGNRIESNKQHGVEIDGSAGEARAIRIGASTDRPSIIGGNGGYGVKIAGATAHGITVDGSWIGVTPRSGSDRWTASANALGGVLIDQQAYGNTIGGTSPNAICANAGPGVILSHGAQGNTVAGNWIGRSRPENEAPGNARGGVFITSGAHGNWIGSTADSHIAGNRGPGIVIRDGGTAANEVSRCTIGAGEVSGQCVPDGNEGPGVDILGRATENTIGTTVAGNLISCNQGAGVRIGGSGTNRNKVVLNYIGTPPGGTSVANLTPWRNVGAGVEITAGAKNNVVGGPDPTYRNWIGNNAASGVLISGAGTSGNYVASNAIGLDQALTVALPNVGNGIEIAEADHNYVGGGGYKGNFVSGNQCDGVDIYGAQAIGNQVVDNVIGLDGAGQAALPNKENGVTVRDGAADTQIKKGTISGNSQRGVEVTGTGTNNVLLSSCIVGLDVDGIDFIPNGTAPNLSNRCGVLYQAGPARAQVRDCRVFGKQAAVYFYNLTFTGALADLDQGNIITGNRVGYNVNGVTRNGMYGVIVEGCHAYVGNNDIRGQGCGLALNYDRPEADPDCLVGVRGCKFRDNDAHIIFYDSARGHLGEYGASIPWKRGENWFGASRRAAVNACEAKSGFTIRAENNDWGTTVAAQIRNRIECPANVDFDPVVGGVTPTGQAIAGTRALVTSVLAQPTAAGASVTFTLSAEAAVTVQIANIAGRPVRTLMVSQPMAAGVHSVAWDGRSEAGTAAPAGLYLVTVTSLTPDGGRSQAVGTLGLQRR